MVNFIGIDIGTSSTKVLITNLKGDIVFSSSKNYNVCTPKKLYSEQDPNLWYDAAIALLKEAFKTIDPKTIEAISFAGQMHGLVMLDSEDKIIRNCLLWNDGRSYKESDTLNKEYKELLIEETGNISFPGFTLSKLLWVKENEPYNFEKINKIMLPKDYLVYRFCNVFVSDYSDMSGTLFMSVKNKEYSKKILNLFGINANWLPKLYESYECVGNINKFLADSLGLKDTVKIIVGAGDNAASAIGSGCVDTSNATVSLGTSATIFLPLDNYNDRCYDTIHNFAHANGKFHYLACILSGASSTGWWINNILKTNHENSYNIDEEKLGENDVFYTPYLSGERCPYNDPLIRGSFVNLSINTTREDMTQAVLEGVAFALRDCKEKMKLSGDDFNKITLVGGGSKNALWAKIISAVLDSDVYQLDNEQGPSLGAAILAMVGSGYFSSIEDATKQLIHKKLTIRKNEKLVEKYGNKYQIYTKIYPSLSHLLHN